MTDAPYNDMSEHFIGTGRKDGKGREIGWIVGLNNNGATYAAWVQSARRVSLYGDWQEFGVQQRSKYFANQADATNWAYATVYARCAKVVA